MCGRFSLTASAEAIAGAFEVEVKKRSPQYNIAPTQTVATVVVKENSRQLQPMRWGLIPSWAKDSKIGSKLINARVKTVTEKPSFRDSIQKRRCLIIADGYYEWQQQEEGKQPYYFKLGEHKLFAFAGLWEQWKSPEGETTVSCTLLTTDAKAAVSPIHDRMPIIVPPHAYSQWLDPNLIDPEEVLPLLESDLYQDLTAYPVTRGVNNPTNDDPECIQPKEASS